MTRTDVLIRKAEAGLSFGGLRLAEEMKPLLKRFAEGEISYESVLAELDRVYKKA